MQLLIQENASEKVGHFVQASMCYAWFVQDCHCYRNSRKFHEKQNNVAEFLELNPKYLSMNNDVAPWLGPFVLTGKVLLF